MNWFAVSVIALQFAASIQYFIASKKADAVIWLLYGVINLVLVFREKLQ